MRCTRHKESTRAGVAKFKVAPYSVIPIGKDGVVRWSLLNWGEDIPKMDQVEIFRNCFEHYNYELYPVRFMSTSEPEKAYLKIAFVREDGTCKLPAPWGTIQSPHTFDAETIAVFHFNYGGEWSGWGFLNEQFFFDKAHGAGRVDLYSILLHEIGHGLGLDHTKKKGDIMFPEYDPACVFTEDSRQGLDKIFGATRRDLAKRIPSAVVLNSTPGKIRKKKRRFGQCILGPFKIDI